jgi:hypothetical protein
MKTGGAAWRLLTELGNRALVAQEGLAQLLVDPRQADELLLRVVPPKLERDVALSAEQVGC